MTKIELARLAAAVNVLRPDWPIASLQTFLANGHAHRPLRDVAVALVWIATDPDTQSPGRLNEPGPWWHASRTADIPTAVNDCPRHPEAHLRVDHRGETTCAGCYADAHEDQRRGEIRDRGGRPIPDQDRQLIAGVIHTPSATAGAATARHPEHAGSKDPAAGPIEDTP